MEIMKYTKFQLNIPKIMPAGPKRDMGCEYHYINLY